MTKERIQEEKKENLINSKRKVIEVLEKKMKIKVSKESQEY